MDANEEVYRFELIGMLISYSFGTIYKIEFSVFTVMTNNQFSSYSSLYSFSAVLLRRHRKFKKLHSAVVFKIKMNKNMGDREMKRNFLTLSKATTSAVILITRKILHFFISHCKWMVLICALRLRFLWTFFKAFSSSCSLSLCTLTRVSQRMYNFIVSIIERKNSWEFFYHKFFYGSHFNHSW